VGDTAGLCVLPVRSAQPQTRARRRRLSTLWSRSPLTPPTKGAASLGAAEMGQAIGPGSGGQRRAWPRHGAVAGGGGAGLGLARINDSGFRVGVPWICFRDWPRAVTASMLRRSLPFQPTLLAISSSNARALSRPLTQETGKHDQATPRRELAC